MRRVKAVRILPVRTDGTTTTTSIKSDSDLIHNAKTDLLGSESSLGEEEENTIGPNDLSMWNVDMELLPASSLEMR